MAGTDPGIIVGLDPGGLNLGASTPGSGGAAAIEWIIADQKQQDDAGGSGPFSIDAPSNISEGDLLVFIKSAPNESGNLQNTGTVPTGFTIAATGANGVLSSGFDPIIEVFTKTATASEPSTYSYDPSGTEDRHVALIGRVPGASGVGSSAQNYYGGTTAPETPTVTASADGLLLSIIAPRNTWTVTASPSEMTELINVAPGSFSVLAVYSEAISAGATGTRSFTLGGSAETMTLAVTLEP